MIPAIRTPWTSPCQVGFSAISAVHCVSVRTKTRSKNSSSGRTRSSSRTTARRRRGGAAVVIRRGTLRVRSVRLGSRDDLNQLPESFLVPLPPMARVSGITTFPVAYPEPNDDGNTRHLLFVRVEADDGTVGWGEAITMFPDATRATADFVNGMA